MAQEAIAFGAPRAEEMTKTVTGIAGAGIAGVVEGTVVMFSKKMGALEPFLSWGALLGVPAIGLAGALFTRGMIGDIAMGVAAGGTAVLGYSLPAMLAPELFAGGRRDPSGRLLNAGNQPGTKLLPAAAASAAAEAARRAMAGAKVGLEF